ncbi:MAG: PEP-utilizing enzyme, partial [Acidimicrobiales bacterium]
RDARTGYALRDDHVGICVQWTGGLLRRALLEAGRRLAAAGVLLESSHVFDLGVDEIADLLVGEIGHGVPDPSQAAARARARSAPDHPPPVLGAPSGPPPSPLVFPPAMAQMTRAVDAYRQLMADHPSTDGPRGTGIGVRSHRGRAVVVADDGEALARVGPGDVLVIAGTNPCLNPVLAIAGAVVSEQGGLLCHTAICARELGLPAIVGLEGATASIPDGAMVEVDAAHGSVEVLTAEAG